MNLLPTAAETRRDRAEHALSTPSGNEERNMKALEHGLELLIFNSRWLLAPIYVGLETQEAPEAAWQARDQACRLARCLAAMKALCGT